MGIGEIVVVFFCVSFLLSRVKFANPEVRICGPGSFAYLNLCDFHILNSLISDLDLYACRCHCYYSAVQWLHEYFYAIGPNWSGAEVQWIGWARFCYATDYNIWVLIVIYEKRMSLYNKDV